MIQCLDYTTSRSTVSRHAELREEKMRRTKEETFVLDLNNLTHVHRHAHAGKIKKKRKEEKILQKQHHEHSTLPLLCPPNKTLSCTKITCRKKKTKLRWSQFHVRKSIRRLFPEEKQKMHAILVDTQQAPRARARKTQTCCRQRRELTTAVTGLTMALVKFGHADLYYRTGVSTSITMWKKKKKKSVVRV